MTCMHLRNVASTASRAGALGAVTALAFLSAQPTVQARDDKANHASNVTPRATTTVVPVPGSLIPKRIDIGSKPRTYGSPSTASRTKPLLGSGTASVRVIRMDRVGAFGHARQ